MKLTCAASDFDFASAGGDLGVVLYGRSGRSDRGSAGAAIAEVIRQKRLVPAPAAWDVLSIALSVVAADLAGHRDRSSDGWTREFDLDVAVTNPGLWDAQTALLEEMLGFLTTDRWRLHFVDRGVQPAPERNPSFPEEDCVVLLSGGLDSFIGAVDLVVSGRRPLAVSQLVRGDAEVQRLLASQIGGGLCHLQLNHNAELPDPENPPSQRARSIIFLAYGVLAATALATYRAGNTVDLYVCENGFISLNPPLTSYRIGSLSTRTSHPFFLASFQRLVDAAGIHVRIVNPYQYKTKGEMLRECRDQSILRKYAHQTTSCGRFRRFGQRHCGRCVPCLIRRAAFKKWGVPDRTKYVYRDLSRDDSDHGQFDDVRAAAMALVEAKEKGVDWWLGSTLAFPALNDTNQLKQVAERGLKELGSLLKAYRVK